MEGVFETFKILRWFFNRRLVTTMHGRGTVVQDAKVCNVREEDSKSSFQCSVFFVYDNHLVSNTTYPIPKELYERCKSSCDNSPLGFTEVAVRVDPVRPTSFCLEENWSPGEFPRVGNSLASAVITLMVFGVLYSQWHQYLLYWHFCMLSSFLACFHVWAVSFVVALIAVPLFLMTQGCRWASMHSHALTKIEPYKASTPWITKKNGVARKSNAARMSNASKTGASFKS